VRSNKHWHASGSRFGPEVVQILSIGAQMLLFVDRRLKKSNFSFENIRGSNPGWGKQCLDALEKQLVKAGVNFVMYGSPSVCMA
jgi:hypothetical protein